MKAPPRILRDRARELRANNTDAERALWSRLRGRQLLGVKFRRQQPVGPFVADFCCLEYGLVVELDGGQHAAQVAADEERTALLEHAGYRVLRFWNNDVLRDIDSVLQAIELALGQSRKTHGGSEAR